MDVSIGLPNSVPGTSGGDLDQVDLLADAAGL
jgi:hypothetical protein